jgi:hypothetical protein
MLPIARTSKRPGFIATARQPYCKRTAKSFSLFGEPTALREEKNFSEPAEWEKRFQSTVGPDTTMPH